MERGRVEGAWRFANRLWRMIDAPDDAVAAVDADKPQQFDPHADVSEAAAVYRAMHKTVARISDDLEKFAFNRAVARVREFANLLGDFRGSDAASAWVRRQGLETLVILVGPMMPHLAEEMWQRLGHDRLLVDTPWPVADPALLVDDTVTVAVQVNGKLRGTIELPKDSGEDAARAAALAVPTVSKAIAGGAPRKVVVVPNRIVNVVL